MLQPEREHRLVQLGAASRGADRRRAAMSSSLATCCVIVEPPSTMRPSARLCLIARSTAIGSTPGCDQKRRSSAAIVAATSAGGSVSGAARPRACPSADSASYSGDAVCDRRRPWTSIASDRQETGRQRPQRSQIASSDDAAVAADRGRASTSVAERRDSARLRAAPLRPSTLLTSQASAFRREATDAR